VIATGFDPEQQNHIVHTEAKRIIHTLEEEQRAAVELSTEDMPQGHLPKEPINTGPTNHAQIESIDQADADQGPVIRHTLFEEEEVEPAYESTLVEAEGQDGPELLNEPFEDYIETTELIRNINVTAEVVDINYLAEFQQVSVNEIEVHDFEIVSVDEQVNEETLETSVQMSAHDPQDQMLMFDLPINQQSSDHIMNLEVEVEEVEAESGVADEIEAEESDALDLSPAELQIAAEQTPIRHVLDDEFIAQEQPEVALEESPAVEEEMTLKTKTQPEKTPAESPESMDPLNTPIAQLLRERAEERKRKMKEFNYKFRNSAAKIDEIERQPAYKRMGIELEDTSDVHEEQISRTTVNLDDDELDLRSNNSFLHDNVD
jgi:cell division protein FtsZ